MAELHYKKVQNENESSTSQVTGSEGNNENPDCEGSESPGHCSWDFSTFIDLGSALRCMASLHTLDFGRMQFPVPKLFSAPVLEDMDGMSSPPVDQHENKERAGDVVEAPPVSFQSKYIHVFPLYQDYCLHVLKADLQRVNKGVLSELVTSKCLPGLQSPPNAHAHGEGTNPQPHFLEGTPCSPIPHVVKVSPSTLWQNLEEVRECGILNSLSTREIRLQEAMFEVIGSEASYLKSLGVAVNHFHASKKLGQTLSRREHHILFSNLCHVTAASEKFLMDLEARLGECLLISQVGDIVLHHCPTFQALYVPYVTNMMYQEALITQLFQENKGFVFALKKIECDPVCQRQSLKSFLVLPFQRITRLKLILENILRLTEKDSDTVFNLKKSIEATTKIVTECDEGVQKMKQIEELVYLDSLLDFSNVKSIPLIASGRFLLHKGPLKQLTPKGGHNSKISIIDVYLHLFNNILIISIKKEHRFSVTDHAEFPTHVHVEQLKTGFLGLPSESFLLRLSQNHTKRPTAIILAAQTSSVKEAWMKLLTS